jgi:hypothetical protein
MHKMENKKGLGEDMFSDSGMDNYIRRLKKGLGGS